MEIDRHKIQLDKPIKETGEHEVPIKLHADVTAKFSVTVKAKGADAATRRGNGGGEAGRLQSEPQRRSTRSNRANVPDEASSNVTAKPAKKAADRGNADLQQKVSYLPDIHRLLPQSPDAEQGVLSSFLLAPREIGGLCAEKRITTAALSHSGARHDLRGAAGDVGREYADRFHHSDPGAARPEPARPGGGAAFVTELFTFLPTAANAAYYIEIVQEKYTLREIIRVCTEYAARELRRAGRSRQPAR